METHQKLNRFTNEIRRSVKIRSNIREEEIIPSIDNFLNNINNESKNNYHYWHPVLKLIDNQKVPDSYKLFQNLPVNFSWVANGLTKIQKQLTVDLFEYLERVKSRYTQLSTDHNIDISDEILKIDSQLIAIKNDPRINDNILRMKALKESINNISTTIKYIDSTLYTENSDLYNGRESFNPDINITSWLTPLKAIIEKDQHLYLPHIKGDKAFYDYNIIKPYVDDINKSVKKMHNKICQLASLEFCMADNYHSAYKDNSMSNFIKQKTTKEYIQESHEFEHGNYKEIIRFKDQSILVKHRDGHFIDILDNRELQEVIAHIIESDIKYNLRKNPTLTKDFIHIFDNNLDNYDDLNRVIKTYLANEDILKLNKYSLLSDFKVAEQQADSFYTHMEHIDDHMHSIVRTHKIKQLAHSISSNKYMNLYNEETYNLIGAIYDLKLQNGVFQDYIGKKIAAYKSPEEFNDALMMFANTMGNFGADPMLSKALGVGADVIINENNLMIVEITDYDQSMALGSPSWCIVRDGGYFESYLEDDNRQFFVYDFTKVAADNASIIGITLDKHNDVYTAHLKNDDQLESDDPLVINLVTKILNEELKHTLNNKSLLTVKNSF